ncbi:MAG TPA: GGDEF domain-containing protein [Patescibacteria group bacterium]|nr:GGDEF domain-containing protein [Patescibacteria group bacterium]
MSTNSSFDAAKATGTYNTLTMILVALALGAAGLHFYIDGKQKFLLQTVDAAQQQYGLVMRVAMLTAQYQADQQDSTLGALKEAGAKVYEQNDILATRFLPVLGTKSMSNAANLHTPGLDAARSLADAAFSYATSPHEESAAEKVRVVSDKAMKDMPEFWGADVAAFAAGKQKEIDLLTYVLYGLCGAAALVALYLSSALFGPCAKYVQKLLEHIDHVAANDTLTGAYNRVALFKVTAMLISGAKRHKQELAVLAIDIDGLQIVNDTFGRAAGDGAIKTVAATLQQVLRNSDVMGRVAGQEFAIFLPATDEYRASLVAEKLRKAVEEVPFAVKEHTVMLRVSIGVAELQPHHKNADDLLRAAETALRGAKDAGRNRVVTLSSISAPVPQPVNYAS